jgi:Uma2 family endonuclease
MDMPVQTLMTAAQFDALPEEEGRKWELLDGELIEVSSATPKHNAILGELHWLLQSFAKTRNLGKALLETDLAVRKDTRLRPDLSYFSAAKWRTIDLNRVPVMETPDIAVEIISPSETAATVNRKIEAYLNWGVHEIWLIYPDTRTLYIHVREGARHLSEGAYLTSEFVPGWQLQIADLFENP